MKVRRIRRLLRFLLPVLLVLVWLGCTSREPGDKPEPPVLTKPTSNPKTLAQDCNVLVSKVCVLPYPSSVFTREDKSTPSGLRFGISSKADFGGVASKLSVFQHDGYSTVNPVTTLLPGGIDPSSIPSTYQKSLAGDASVLLVNADPASPLYGQRVPFQAEIVKSSNKKDELLVLTPLKAMAFGSRYAVIVTSSVRNRSKEAHKPSETMKTLLAAFPPEDETLKKWWTYYRDLHWLAVKELKLSKESIVQMWDFHTRSKESTTADLLTMAAWTKNWLKNNPPKPNVVEKKEEGNHVRYTFSFSLPIWTPKDGIYPARDKDGAVKMDRVETIKAELIVPKSATTDKPVQLMIFGHGLGSSRGAMLDSLRKFLELKAGVFGLAIMDWDMHGSRGRGLAQILETAGNLDVLRFASMFQQSAVDTLVFTEAIKALLQIPELKGKALPPRFYVGQSMGGFVGTLASTFHPTLEAFVLNVTGGGMGNVMRKGALAQFGLRDLTTSVLAGKTTAGLPKDLSVEFALQNSQLGLDPGDPISFAPFVLKDRWKTLREKQPYVLMQQSVGDSIVPNFATNTLARTIGLSVILPVVVEIPGLPTAPAPTLGDPSMGLTQFRTATDPAKAHGALANKVLRQQVMDYFASFLQKDGKSGNIVYSCNNGNKACDLVK